MECRISEKEFIQGYVGVHYDYDQSRTKELGITNPIFIDQAILDTAEDLIKIGREKKL
jgi:hypothetical protein